VWPDLGAWRLPVVSEHVGVELDHHDALSDAHACSAVLAGCIRDAGAQGISHLGEIVGVTPRLLGERDVVTTG
jgi:DNA polymerase-3 subunit epsilon